VQELGLVKFSIQKVDLLRHSNMQSKSKDKFASGSRVKAIKARLIKARPTYISAKLDP
jgi:hypothetical protein